MSTTNPLVESASAALARLSMDDQLVVLEALNDNVRGRGQTGAKAAAILAGVPTSGRGAPEFYGDNYTGDPFLAALKSARAGDPDGNAYIKAVLGTSAAP